MIFVTVGTHDTGFDRLVTAVDQLAAEWDEEIIIQRGSSDYKPQFATHFEWASSKRMGQLTSQARVLITHAAAGAIILGLQKQTPLIVVPRLQRHGECIDDHQLQLARALSKQGRAIAVLSPTALSLRDALSKVKKGAQAALHTNQQLVNAIEQQLTRWETAI